MLQTDLTRLVQLLTGRYAPNANQVINEVSAILASVSELSNTAEGMLRTSSPQEIQRVAEMWYFSDVLPRHGSQTSTEFEWACDYTISSLVLLREYVSNNMAISGIARNIQTQIGLWEMRTAWPQVLPEQDPSLEIRITGLYQAPPSRGFR